MSGTELKKSRYKHDSCKMHSYFCKINGNPPILYKNRDTNEQSFQRLALHLRKVT